jgi:flagellar biosynthesis protein FliQ
VNAELPGALTREAFLVLATTAGPYVGALLVVGLVVGIAQAATQINDPAVGFLPRLLAGVGTAAVLGAWTLDHLAHFLAAALGRMATHL